MIKKGIKVRGLSFIISLLLVGWIGSTSLLAQQQVTLRCWQFGGLFTEVEHYKKMTDEFNKAHPNIKVKITNEDYSLRRPKVTTAFAAGTLPDLISSDSSEIAENGPQMGIYIPLDLEFPEDVAEFRARFPEPVLDSCTIEGHLWAIATYVDLDPVLSWNVKLLKEAGYDGPPATWSELAEYAVKLTKNGVYGFAFPARAGVGDMGLYFREFLMMAGGRWLNEEGTKIIFNHENGVAALQWLYDLVNKYKVTPPDILDIDFMKIQTLFIQERLAMGITGLWFAGVAKDMGAPADLPYQLTVPFPPVGTDFPKGEFRQIPGFVGASGAFAIVSTSEHKKEAWEYIKWMARDDSLIAWANYPIVGRSPVSKKVLLSEICKENAPYIYKPYEEGTLLKGRMALPMIPAVSEMDAVFESLEQEALLGMITPKEALDKAQTGCQKILDELKE